MGGNIARVLESRDTASVDRYGRFCGVDLLLGYELIY